MGKHEIKRGTSHRTSDAGGKFIFSTSYSYSLFDTIEFEERKTLTTLIFFNNNLLHKRALKLKYNVPFVILFSNKC